MAWRAGGGGDRRSSAPRRRWAMVGEREQRSVLEKVALLIIGLITLVKDMD